MCCNIETISNQLDQLRRSLISHHRLSICSMFGSIYFALPYKQSQWRTTFAGWRSRRSMARPNIVAWTRSRWQCHPPSSPHRRGPWRWGTLRGWSSGPSWLFLPTSATPSSHARRVTTWMYPSRSCAGTCAHPSTSIMCWHAGCGRSISMASRRPAVASTRWTPTPWGHNSFWRIRWGINIGLPPWSSMASSSRRCRTMLGDRSSWGCEWRSQKLRYVYYFFILYFYTILYYIILYHIISYYIIFDVQTAYVPPRHTLLYHALGWVEFAYLPVSILYDFLLYYIILYYIICLYYIISDLRSKRLAPKAYIFVSRVGLSWHLLTFSYWIHKQTHARAYCYCITPGICRSEWGV